MSLTSKKPTALPQQRLARFYKREQARLLACKKELFSEDACRPGCYRNRANPICLHADYVADALHESIRPEAAEYFRARRIPWHSLGHLLCSQTSCVNALFPFVQDREALQLIFRELGYDVARVLTFDLDQIEVLRELGWKLADGSQQPVGEHYLAFEWIGAKNYLRELARHGIAGDAPRGRGQNFSAVDFAIRFERSDGTIQIVLAEWKYTEQYRNAKCKRISGGKVDRLESIYRVWLEHPSCQIQMPHGIRFEDLFYDPFDQMMRHQLLASAMEREREMDASIVSTLHIAPQANRELVYEITSPNLKRLGGTIYEVWHQSFCRERFHHVTAEQFLAAAINFSANEEWKRWMKIRYGGMQ